MTDCMKKPMCCCVIATVGTLILAIGGALIYSYSRPNISGDVETLDEHKSFIERLSLLSLSNAGARGSGSWNWIGAILVLATVGGLAYTYYRKVKLPQRRANREATQQRRMEQEAQQQFIIEMMNRPAPQ